MIKYLMLISFAVFSLWLTAQEKMYIHTNQHITFGAKVSLTDSVYFDSSSTTAFFRVGDTLASWPINEIDSITFGKESDTIDINYTLSGAYVVNPLAFEKVYIDIQNDFVTVHSLSDKQDIVYRLSGTTAEGNFKIYSNKRFTIILNGVSITNPIGPAINIQSEKKATILISGSVANQITDGLVYDNPPLNPNGEPEDQDGAFFSEAKLVFQGSGQLNISGNGNDQHALCSDDFIEINNGVINITKATKDGIHANDGLSITGGTVQVAASGDGIDGDGGLVSISGGTVDVTCISNDAKGISCDSTLVVSAGIISIHMSGEQAKALKCKQNITLSGGDITLQTTGNSVLVASGLGFDPAYTSAIKSDQDITIDDATVHINCSGKANKAISADGNFNMLAGEVNITNSGTGAKYTNTQGIADAYIATCITADVSLNIEGGTIVTSSSGSGGKSISCDGTLQIGTDSSSPSIDLTTTGTRILISGQGNNAYYAEAKTVKCDGSITINNGDILIHSADDGIKSETSISINLAEIEIVNSTEGVEAPYITINSGNVKVKSSDDCLNSTFGNGGENDDGSMLMINNGYVVLNTTGGDGLDSNGDMEYNNGTIIVHGPPSAPEVGMDYNGTCNMNGGFLVVSGTNSNMTQAPSTSSTQHCLKAVSGSQLSSTTLFHLQDASGNNLLTFQPMRNYYSIVFSSEQLTAGGSYSIYTGGSSTGTNNNGLYEGGVYSGGTLKKTFTVNSMITNVTF